MTKIKTTKKGMAKKTLSMSLVLAMLATSNVPVWAADFSDGTDTAVAAEAEAPVVDATEEFSDDAAQAAVVEEAPVVEENTEAVAATDVANSDVTADVTFAGADSKNTIDWWAVNHSITATISSVKINGIELGSTLETSKYELKYAWKVNGVAEQESEVNDDTLTHEVSASEAGKTISLILILKESDSEKTLWSQEYTKFTVNYRQISDYVKINPATTIENPTYDGQAHDKESVPTGILVGKEGSVEEAFTSADSYNVTYSAKDFVNVTDEGITVTLTPKADILTGYTGSVSYTYQIAPKELHDYAADMVATLNTTSYVYTGKVITKIKASDITLKDKKTGVDLSNYLNVDKDGYVGVDSTNLQNVSDGEKNIWVDLIEGTPETGCKNYSIAPENEQYARRIQTSNTLKVVARDLSTVNVTISAQTGSKTGNAITISDDDVLYTDKTTGEVLLLNGDVDVKVPADAIQKGSYTATISPKTTTQNVTGETKANFNIVAADISAASFANEQTIENTAKPYTGEPITFTAKELGALTLDGKTIDPSEYDITFGANVNAKTGNHKEGVIIVKGKGSFEGSEKRIYFDITPATLDTANTKANQYVEIINTKNASDYAESMGIVVKATNTANKVFTLTEGKDYTVEYSCPDNTSGEEVTATITIINDSFKNDQNTVTTTVESTITPKAIKDANIKLKETDFTYTGKAIKPDFDVVIDGKIINSDLYDVTYTNNLNAGTATISVKGKDGSLYYSDKASAKATFTIKPADASKLEGVLPSKAYKGYSLEIPADEINVTLNGERINVADNFTLTYGENVQIGDGTVTLTPKNGNFTGTKTLTFKIVAELLKNGTLTFYDENGVKVADPEFDYDGTAHTFGKVVFSSENTEVQNEAGRWDNFSKTLTEGTDYEIKYVDNVSGKAHFGAVLVVAKGKFGGAYEDEDEDLGITGGVYTDAEGNQTSNVIYARGFRIMPQIIRKNNITISNATYAGGLPVKPQVSIVVNGKTLIEGQDFEVIVSPKDIDLTQDVEDDLKYILFNTDLANATTGNTLYAYIRGLNGYKVTSRVGLYKWGINKFDLANADVTVDGDNVTVKCGRVDVESSEYTVEKKDNTLTVTANKNSRNYTGSKTVSIKPEAEKPATPVIASATVSGNKATVALAGEAEGAIAYDYVIGTSADCIETEEYVGESYGQVETSVTFSDLAQGTYYAYCRAWKRDDAGKKVYSDWSAMYPISIKVITPETPVITETSTYTKNGKKYLTVKYTQCADAENYAVVVGTDAKKSEGQLRPVEVKYTKNNIVGTKVTTTFVVEGNKTYYVGLRAYNKTGENGKKVYSKWSNIKPQEVK